jgi:uncharacterized protein (DUF305 family)
MKQSIFAAALLIFIGGFSAQAADMVPKDEAHFLEMMSEHHKDGIKMAEMAESKAQSKDVKSLAKKISKDQKSETQKMQSWKKNWYPNENVAVDMPKMDMSKLETASGKEFDKQFLAMMTKHHQDGIEMMNASMPKLQHKETKSMAEKGVKKQTAEIEKMDKLQSTIQ